jgi:hypothetical protein
VIVVIANGLSIDDNIVESNMIAATFLNVKADGRISL